MLHGNVCMKDHIYLTENKMSLVMPSVIASLIAVTVAAFPNPATARVLSATAEYNRGVTIITGRTSSPGEYVRLDGRLIQRSNQVGHFRFRVPQLPSACTVRIQSDGKGLTAKVRNCPVR